MTPADLRAARKALGHHLRAAQELLEMHGYKVKPPMSEEDRANRFWARVSKSKPGDCWLWTGCVDRKGYGLFRTQKGSCGAHRYSWQLANGCAVPQGWCVMHVCDVPGCVNPAHLKLGSNAENMADKVAKGRQAKGRDAIGAVKLTEEKVRSIRASREPHANLAHAFGVSEATIRMIRSGKTWRHVT